MAWQFMQETVSMWSEVVLPEEYRPSDVLYAPAVSIDQSGRLNNVCAFVSVDTNGKCSLQTGAAKTGAWNCGTVVWLL